jgi:hypothetical protein
MGPECYTPVALAQYFLIQPGIAWQGCSEILSSRFEELPRLELLSYLKVLATTCALELPIYLLILVNRSALMLKVVLAAILVNIASHPLVYFGFPWLSIQLGLSYAPMLASAEVFAPALEIVLLLFCFQFSKTRASVGAVAANLFSWWVGVYFVTEL